MHHVYDIYHDYVRRPPEVAHDLTKILITAFRPLTTFNTNAAVVEFLAQKPFVAEIVRERAEREKLYRNPWILIVYYLAATRPNLTIGVWPLTQAELQPILTDLGYALEVV